MRNFFRSLFLIVLTVTQFAAAAATSSRSGTTIPAAAQIVDDRSNVWTLSGGQVYENGGQVYENGSVTPSGAVILLLCDGGAVYQENIHHNWWV